MVNMPAGRECWLSWFVSMESIDSTSSCVCYYTLGGEYHSFDTILERVQTRAMNIICLSNYIQHHSLDNFSIQVNRTVNSPPVRIGLIYIYLVKEIAVGQVHDAQLDTFYNQSLF